MLCISVYSGLQWARGKEDVKLTPVDRSWACFSWTAYISGLSMSFIAFVNSDGLVLIY